MRKQLDRLGSLHVLAAYVLQEAAQVNALVPPRALTAHSDLTILRRT